MIGAPTVHRRAAFDALPDVLRDFVPHILRLTGTPGLNIAIGDVSGVTWEHGFGVADLGSRTPMSADVVSCGGSLTKTYVAIAIMQLVERGRLSLHAPVNRYLTEFQVVNPLGDRDVTIYDALTYRSGLATDSGDYLLAPPPPLTTWLERALAGDLAPEYQSGRSRWASKVGERFAYSNLGMALLGHVVELVNPRGLDFSDYVAQEICEPCGLRSTAVPRSFAERTAAPLLSRASTGYARFGSTLVETPRLYAAAYPALTVLTTPGDHVELLATLLRGGAASRGRLLRRETVQLMLTAQVDATTNQGPAGWYGVGLQLKHLGAACNSFGHGGTYAWGWWNEAHAYPSLGIVVAAFSNKRNTMGWYNPESETAPGIVQRVASSWLSDGERAVRQYARSSERSWDWKASYACGLTMAERLRGSLGILDQPSRGLVDQLSQARPYELSTPRAWEWDADAFRDGLMDVLATSGTAEDIRRLLATDRLRVTREDLDVLALEFGRRGGYRAPLTFWADDPSTRRLRLPVEKRRRDAR